MKKKEKPNNNNSKDNDFIKNLIISILIVICLIAAFAIYYFNVNKVKNEEKELDYTEFITSINEDSIEKIKMTTGSSTLTVTMVGEGEEKDREKTVIVPSIQAFMEWIQEKIDKEGVSIELIQVPVNPILKISDTLFSLLPTILLIVLMVMIIKMQGFGGDSGKVYGGEDGSKKTDVRFDDIAGLDEEKAELVEIVDLFRYGGKNT